MVGADPLPRGEAVSKIWAYIKRHGPQDPQVRRQILADAKLEPVRLTDGFSRSTVEPRNGGSPGDGG